MIWFFKKFSKMFPILKLIFAKKNFFPSFTLLIFKKKLLRIFNAIGSYDMPKSISCPYINFVYNTIHNLIKDIVLH